MDTQNASLESGNKLKFINMWKYFDEKLYNIPEDVIEEIEEAFNGVLFEKLKEFRKRYASILYYLFYEDLC